MQIKEVAELTGASRKAIYLYESMQLLTNIARDANMYRNYTDHHVKVIRLVKQAQELGFKLAEIAPMVEEKRITKQFPTALVVERINLKRAAIESEIAILQEQHGALAVLAQEVIAADM
jgi:DNA-binding transcriptional MerR regulator